MSPPFSSSAVLPPKLAWLLATRPVFLYPELLPHCSLDPALHTAPCKVTFTKGEDRYVRFSFGPKAIAQQNVVWHFFGLTCHSALCTLKSFNVSLVWQRECCCMDTQKIKLTQYEIVCVPCFHTSVKSVICFLFTSTIC